MLSKIAFLKWQNNDVIVYRGAAATALGGRHRGSSDGVTVSIEHVGAGAHGGAHAVGRSSPVSIGTHGHHGAGSGGVSASVGNYGIISSYSSVGSYGGGASASVGNYGIVGSVGNSLGRVRESGRIRGVSAGVGGVDAVEENTTVVGIGNVVGTLVSVVHHHIPIPFGIETDSAMVHDLVTLWAKKTWSKIGFVATDTLSNVLFFDAPPAQVCRV